MTEREERLAELNAKRAEINRQIREVRKMGEVSVDGARIARRTTYAYRDEEWTVGVEVDKVHHASGQRVSRFVSVYTGNTKRECVDAIPGIIETLKRLYKAAGGEIIGNVKVKVGGKCDLGD